MATIQCNIVSPEGELFSGEVEVLSAEGGSGEIAITPRHAPLLTNLKPGPVKLTLEGGEEEVFFASGGFLEVQPGEVTLLTDVAERADDIDSAEISLNITPINDQPEFTGPLDQIPTMTLANINEDGGQEVPHLHFHLFGGEKVGKMVS